MRKSINGNFYLPETQQEYEKLLAAGQLPHSLCCFCNQSHIGRTHTRAGWAETQISGACEDCFDNLFKEEA